MNILLSRMRALAFFALFWGAWFNAAVGGPVEALSKLEKTVLYREPSLWERHPRLILATAAILVLQSLLIVGLIVQRSRWKRAEQSLRDSEERMNLAAEAADLDELRAILKDIREDGWRAGEVIRRMRSLLKRHQFKMEQIEVEGLPR